MHGETLNSFILFGEKIKGVGVGEARIGKTKKKLIVDFSAWLILLY
jgi:hypothetical protein